jgi:osmotically-inducible protein OsmY
MPEGARGTGGIRSESKLRMKRIRRLPCRAFALIATSLFAAHVLCGCAAYQAYRKCGTAGCPGDAQITADVRSLLRQHPELGPPNEVYVQTLDRVVYLSGQLATGLQRETAEALARHASGERPVVDTISLEYNGR